MYVSCFSAGFGAATICGIYVSPILPQTQVYCCSPCLSENSFIVLFTVIEWFWGRLQSQSYGFFPSSHIQMWTLENQEFRLWNCGAESSGQQQLEKTTPNIHQKWLMAQVTWQKKDSLKRPGNNWRQWREKGTTRVSPHRHILQNPGEVSDREAWHASVSRGVAKSWTWLTWLNTSCRAVFRRLSHLYTLLVQQTTPPMVDVSRSNLANPVLLYTFSNLMGIYPVGQYFPDSLYSLPSH